MIDLSIVMVSYNTRALLDDCLQSLAAGASGFACETIVVDNASSDGSADLVAADYPSVTLIRNPDNRGFAAANNLALVQSTGRYVVLLNPDTVVESDALTELVRFMDAHPDAGYCGPRLHNEDGTHQTSARRFPTLLSAAWNALGWDKRYPTSKHCADLHHAQGDNTTMPAGWLTGACLVVRREAMECVGMLDDGYFMYFEETDWCKRIANAGWQGWYVPSAQIMHLGGGSSDPATEVAPFFGNRPAYWLASRRRYMRRHHGILGLAVAEAIEVVLMILLWMRHRWRQSPESRIKVRRASATLRHLIGRGASSQT